MSTSSRRGSALRFPLAAYLLLLLPLALLLRPAAVLAAATPRVHAIVNARIVTAPGQVIGRGTVVIRDGVIEAVGERVAVPADARVWPGDSLTVYAGLIDPFVMPAEAPAGGGRPGRPGMGGGAEPSRGAAHELSSVHPEYRVVDNAPLAKDQLESLRAAGFTLADVVPRRGIVRGQSAVMSLGDQDANASVVRADAALVVSLEALRDGYPGSLMGGIAVIRQAFMDAKWYRDAATAYAKKATTERPETNVSWAAMQPAISNTQPVLFLADEMLEVLRSGHIAKEAGVTARIVGAGDEYKRVADIAALGYPLIVPVNFPDAPDVANADNAMDVSIEELRHWQQAPGNAAALQKAGVSFAFTSNGLKDAKTFRANVAKAIARGLKPTEALAAVTTIPAQQLGLDKQVGTIAPGKIANLTVTRGELFSDKSKLVEVWVDGNRYQVQKDEGIKGNWTIGWGHDTHLLMVSVDKDTSVKLVVGADTLTARNVAYQDDRVSFTVQRGGEAAEDFVLREKLDRVSGTLSVAGVGSHDVIGSRKPDDEKGKGKGKGDDGKDEVVPTPLAMGNTEAWRLSPPEQPAAVLVKNATIWTAGPQGTLEHTDLLVKAGKIAAIGKNLTAPAKAVVIDAEGKHVAPGIIDEHSHSAILGNVNECTNSVTCEVRIADVINSESINIYRQLAGGVTVMHLLHGSCNSIGGQCAVIRNKWGEAPDRLVFAEAPPTVKFALGENVKQSNWGSDRTGRYPQSRAGVEETFRDAFTRAIDYRSALAEFKSGKRALPPRRDLQLDALVEILEGKRLVHCHSYRQDEILMLMRVAEQFGFRINTFTHILEGYKVADELKAHGASALGFTDWWAYKQEVIDAIPYNGYILWNHGVNTGFNSDSDELARRLNSEAGKAIKYGGVPPDEAIKFVTLNAAKSLKIDGRVGSLEVGKDADFAIWNGPPMSALSLCEQTWIEGRKYFDRAEDLAGREAYAKERSALIAKALAAKKDAPATGGGTRRWPPRYLDDTDLSGNATGDEEGHVMPFRSEAERAAQRNGEVVR